MMKMNEPLLPSFSNSRTYTYESDDNVNNEDMSSVADSSMASESLGGDAASMTSSNAVMSSPGINIPSPGSSSNNGSSNNNGNNGNNGGNGNGVSPGSYSAKSARFKSAMTTRARQRRMRRMREREPSSSQSHSQSQPSHQSPDNSNRSNNGGNNIGDGKSTVMTSRSNTAALLPSSPGTPGSRSSIDGCGGGGGGGGDPQPLPSSSPGIPPIPTQPASHGGSNNPHPPTSPGSADRIQGAKDHVEQMKLHRSRAGTTTATTTTPAVTTATTTATTTGSPPPPPTSMTPNTTNNNAPSSSFASPTGSTTSNNTVSPLQNRVYQAHRSRSLSRSREMSPSSSSVASYSYSSPSSDHHRRSELPSPNNLSFSSGGSNNNNNNNNNSGIIMNGANAHNSNSRSPSNVPKATMSQRSSSDGSFPTTTTTSTELERNNNHNNNNRQNMPTPVMMSNNASSVDAFLSTQSTNQQSTLNNNNMSYQLPDRIGSNSDDASFPRYTDMDNNPSFYDSFEQLRQQQQQEQQQSTPDTSSKLPNPYVNNHDAFSRQQQEQHQQPAPPDGDNSFYNPREHHHHPQEQEQQEQPIPPPPPPPPKQPNPNAPTTAFQQHPTLPARTTPKQTRRSKRDKYEASQTKTEEFLPDWKKGDSISDAVLTGDEVRDAANFTSIQFQCSNLSGEVEMFSDQGSINAPDGGGGFDAIAELASVGSGELDGTNEDSRDFKQLWQNEVWINNSRTNNSMGGSDVGRGGALSPAQYGRTKSDLVQSNLGGGGGGGGDGHSEATTPSIFHRGEIFHQKAAASIVSLLSPDRMFEAGLMAPEITQSEEDDAAKDVEGDSPTGVAPPGGPRDLNGMFTFDGDADPSSSRGGEWKGTTQVKRSLFEEGGVGGGVGGSSDADDDVRKSVIFQKFRERMMQPSSQLSELLGQIHRASGRVAIDRAFATRRKNACGALKILSAKVENRMKICWTIGVLPAIASVLSDVHEGISDDLARAANTEARNRVVSTLLNLSVNKKNRMLIVNTPGVLESMMQTIKYDMGEGRQGCCTVLLYLAKTAEARGMIVKSAGMMDVLAEVVAVPKKQTNPPILKNKTRSPRVMMLQTPAQRPTRPLSPNDENTLEGTTVDGTTVDGTATVDTGRSSFRSRSGSYSDGDDDDDSRTSDGSHYSGTTHSCDSKSSVDSRKSDYDHDEDSQDSRTVESSVDDRSKAVKHVEISFERASTAQTGNLASPGGTAAVGKGGVNTKAKVGDAATAARGKKLPNEDDEDIYDADPNRFLHGARLSIFACLLCLVKSRENAYLVAREVKTVEALIGVSRRHPSPSHSRAMAILAHLTRHPKNCHTLVYNYSSLLPMLQGAMASPDKEARRYAFCALQNLSMDKSCRAPIAHSPKIIWSLTERCKLGLSPSGGDKHDRKTSPYLASSLSDDNEDEARVAAVATLQNLSDEPANLIQFTIVKDCIGTIIQIAREDVVRNEKTDLTSFMAKNTLVTLSHWFRKIATSGSERMGGKGLGNMACIPHPGNGRDSTAMVRGNSGGSDRNQVGADVHLRTQMYLYNARLEPTIFDQWT